jgi:4-carboxymuconolactone decarboxylase
VSRRGPDREEECVARIPEVELPEDLPVKNNLVRVAYNNPDMFRGFASLSGRVHSASHLPDRLRELVILRTTGMLDADYEWTAHARIATRQGVTSEELEALKTGQDDYFEGAERAAVAFAAAVDRREVDEAAWKAARAFFSEVELLDMTLLAGFYALASRFALALDIEPDPAPALG